MRLDPIEKRHLIQAASIMDIDGDDSWSEYWVRLDNGKEYQFKRIVRLAYEIATGIKVDSNFFQSNKNNRSYIERKFGYKVFFRVPKNIPFFTQEELNFFSKHAGASYKSGDKDDQIAGRKIFDSIYRKTTIWGRMLNLHGWKVDFDNRWQISGYFKSYSWLRIYKLKDKDAKVFFTLGVEGKSKTLVYKLDCQRQQVSKKNALNKIQVAAFDRVNKGTGAELNKISSDDLKIYNWNILRELTIDFIDRYEFLYTEAVEAVLEHTQPIIGTEGETSEEPLIEVSVPKKAFDKLPKKRYSFKGVSVDYDAENKYAKLIGDGGERLVIAKEKKFLNSKPGLEGFAKRVDKAEDGEGYDVLSFDINGNKKYIEVKTTTGRSTRPFIMSDNEWEFMKRNPKQYHLYRIFDYDTKTKRGKMFCLTGNIEEQVLTRQKHIEVFLKSSKD